MLLHQLLQQNPIQCYNSLMVLKDILLVMIPIVVAIITYKYAVIKIHKEVNVQLKKEWYSKKLAACQAVWPLLAYTSTVENSKSVLRFTRNNDNSDTWYLLTENALAYIHQLTTIFYTEGHGLFLQNTELKASMFEYRNQLYGFLLKEKDSLEIVITNSALLQRLKELHETIMYILKKEVELFPEWANERIH